MKYFLESWVFFEDQELIKKSHLLQEIKNKESQRKVSGSYIKYEVQILQT